ncbi:MAG: hypothetical protein I3273_06345 [Candidatus Moeniiplasma glomeromycotorum]|nr:hypothetical protein [Candidatus Moeniiplasma glomeromycotorum]MCE8169705.1 hypothetical protein [Candidatus Moeniiplasma glomeromycotorum]
MAHLTKTYQGNLKPTSKTKKQLQFISKGCNEVYNHFLIKRIKTDRKISISINSRRTTKRTSPIKEKEILPVIKQNPSLNSPRSS